MPIRLSMCIVLLLIPLGAVAVENEIAADFQEYRLGTGDKIRIQVYNEEDLYLEARVNDTGEVSYPFLGVLKVLDTTPGQLENLITSKLKGDYLINPKVSVDIIEYRQFYVNGEVETPGGFPFQPGITVRKAISIAGGFRERASKDKIFIIRGDKPDTKPVRASLDEKVWPGDIITVEESFF